MVATHALFTESFPTRLRATAQSWGKVWAVLGALGGLGAIGALADAAGGAAGIVTALAVLSALASPLFFLPRETARADLDEIDGL